ncbi:MAG TPA: MurR/RpiR family transcriptional regulator [Burkholderiaceae bacterium]
MADAPSVVELMDTIAAEFDSLPRQLKIIAKYVEQHRASLMLARVSDIAVACDVQPSAIVRFAKRFGFSGFTELQDVFRQAYTSKVGTAPNYKQRIRKLIDVRDKKVQPGAMAREFFEASRVGLEELSAGLDDAQFAGAVQLLQEADSIHVVGVRRAFPAASYLAYALQHTNKPVHLVSGLGSMYRQQMRGVRKGDVLVAISFAPYGKETQYCTRIAHFLGAKLLVITDSSLSPLARHADALLTVTEGNAYAFRALTSTISLCQALFVALAYRLELDLGETREFDEDDADY